MNGQMDKEIVVKDKDWIKIYPQIMVQSELPRCFAAYQHRVGGEKVWEGGLEVKKRLGAPLPQDLPKIWKASGIPGSLNFMKVAV